MSLTLRVAIERWPLEAAFSIARGAKIEAVVIVAELADGAHRGRGEGVPYARYGETVAGGGPPHGGRRAPRVADRHRPGAAGRRPPRPAPHPPPSPSRGRH